MPIVSLPRSIMIRHRIKRALYSLLPDHWQEGIDRRFYHLRLARGDLSSEPEFALLSLLVHEGDVVVDVGANLGGYAIGLSRLVGRSGTVHCLEPVPRTFRLLEHNVRRLAPHPNVRLHRLAASDASGTTEIHLPLEGSLENFYTASLASEAGTPHRTVRVEMTTLEVLLGDAPVSFLKVDTEGAEWAVLRGAANTLERSRPAILCELAGGIRRFGHEPRDVFAMLSPLGYLAFRFVDGWLVEVDGPDDRRMPNYLFIGPDRFGVLAPSASGPVRGVSRLTR